MWPVTDCESREIFNRDSGLRSPRPNPIGWESTDPANSSLHLGHRCPVGLRSGAWTGVLGRLYSPSRSVEALQGNPSLMAWARIWLGKDFTDGQDAAMNRNDTPCYQEVVDCAYIEYNIITTVICACVSALDRLTCFVKEFSQL